MIGVEKMSVNPVTSGTVALQTLRANSQDPKNQFEQAQQNLEQSLSSGNLSGAKQAYDSLSKLIQNGPGAKNGQAFGGNTTIQKDFAAIGSALKSGDASGAQKAFLQFTQDLKSAHSAQAAQSAQRTDSDGDHDNSGAGGGNGSAVDFQA